jgi:intracellular multiplication protein IcmL
MHDQREHVRDLENGDRYRDQYRRHWRQLMVLIGSAFIWLGLYMVVGLFQSTPNYYASTTTGDVLPLDALSSPVVTTEYIQQWSEMVARKAYNLDFLNFNQSLSQVRPYFSDDGWLAFQDALTKSGLLNKIQQEKLTLSAVANGPVVILKRYVTAGRYSWDVQLPLLVTYSSSSMQAKQQLYIAMTIRRVPELATPQGIAVTAFILGGGQYVK